MAFGVTRAKGASDVTVDDLIEKRLEKIAGCKHPDVKFTKVDTQVDKRSRQLSLDHGDANRRRGSSPYVVVFIFLCDLRATLVTAIALPLSVIPTFWAMRRYRLLAQSREPSCYHARDWHPG